MGSNSPTSLRLKFLGQRTRPWKAVLEPYHPVMKEEHFEIWIPMQQNLIQSILVDML